MVYGGRVLSLVKDKERAGLLSAIIIPIVMVCLYVALKPRCSHNEAIWILVERHEDGFIEFKKTIGPPDDYTKNASNYWIAHPYQP